ncbi:MAG TPA: acyltransferase [Acidobacteriaceae bacterium]|nr:acyltransferase [Acidobacteriaceae bacterium]
MTALQSAPVHQVSGESRHYPELDGVRGLAILGVLLAHAANFLAVVPATSAGHVLLTIFMPGWGGVDLFFTLSGFLITGILLRTRTRSHYFSSFYMRRVLRIFPIYYLFLIGSVIFAHFSPMMALRIPSNLETRISYFVYLQNWPIFWQGWMGLSTFWGAYWSLAVEEQFYMVWPTILRFVKPRMVLLLCIAAFLLGWPERLYMFHHVGLALGVMQWPFSRLDGLFVGAIIALYKELYGRAIPIRWATISFLSGAAIFLQIAAAHSVELGNGNGIHVWTSGVTAFALMSGGLIAASQHRIGWLHRILTVRPLVIAGRLSYGMYIYHLTIYQLIVSFRRRFIIPQGLANTNILVCLAWIAFAILVVTGVAELSFRFVEAPFLRLKRFFPSPAAPAVQN